MKAQNLVCGCNSLQHQLYFWYDEDDKELYVTVHLTTYRNFFKRFWAGIKYAFGFKSNYGCFDEFLFTPESQTELLIFLNNLQNVQEEK